MKEKIITESAAEEIRCISCNELNPIEQEWCNGCGCALWEDPQTEQENETCNGSPSWSIYGLSHKGRRQNNEDAYAILKTELYHDDKLKKVNLLAVADGMGGIEAGEEASKTAVSIISCFFTDNPLFLKTSIKVANTKIYIEGLKKSIETGTTIVSALIMDEEIHVFWAGDSPLYHIRKDEIIYRTEDHTESAKSNILTKSLGAGENIELSEIKLQTKPGDAILLCSDGLCGFVSDAEILSIIEQNPNPRDSCNNLLRTAFDNGSNDNITAIFARLS